MIRESFVFYRSFYEAIEKLPDDQQLKVYKALANYALNGIDENIEGVAGAMLICFRPQIDANNRRYKNTCKALHKEKNDSKDSNDSNENKSNQEKSV